LRKDHRLGDASQLNSAKNVPCAINYEMSGLGPPPLSEDPSIAEADAIGVELGSSLCLNMSSAIAGLGDGIQPSYLQP
jgi:hypothetical protein